jgi:hypothetical protein
VIGGFYDFCVNRSLRHTTSTYRSMARKCRLRRGNSVSLWLGPCRPALDLQPLKAGRARRPRYG